MVAMPKLFPEKLPIKLAKCPECGEGFHEASVAHHEDRVVRAKCPREGCDYVLDLFWIGDAVPA
jgi:ribosomal protein S27AE